MYQIVTKRTSERASTLYSSDQLTVRIDRIVPGGYGLARHEGRTVLVPLVAPGDLVVVAPKDKGPFAELVEIRETGPNRTEPICQHYGECGGCDLMHMAYDAQLDAKRGIVLDSLKRIGGQDLDLPFAIVANPAPFNSRIRANWHPTSGGKAGYVRRGTNEIIEILDCPILDPVLERTRRALRIAKATAALSNGQDASVESLIGPAPEICFSVGGERMYSSASTFFQANGALLDSFVVAVVQAASALSPVTVWDIYAGVGLFSGPMARRGAHVTSVESDPLATEFARRNQIQSGLDNVIIQAGTAEDWLDSDHPTPDVIVVDPPRTGLSKSVSRALVRRQVQTLVYVSCDPATFARDHALLRKGGYELTSIAGFDLFPQTHHVELLTTYAPC